MYIRTYKLKHNANEQKLDVLMETLKEYQNAACKVSSKQWYQFFTTGKFNKYEATLLKQVETPLSARYKQTVQHQVGATLNSFISNRKNDFRKVVYKSSLSEDQKKALYKVNNQNKWFERENLLARKIFKKILSKHNIPNFSKCNMLLNANQITIEKSKTGTFDYWAKVSTLIKGKPIYIPLLSNKFFDSKEHGTLCKALQVNCNREGLLSFSLIKQFEQEEYFPETESIGLDLGLEVLYTTDKGDLLGRNFYKILQRYDQQISALACNRQKQGLKTRSPRYDRLVGRLRNFLKNEINRVLNRVVTLYKPMQIVIERLNFQGARLSRRLNRLLSNFGKGIISKKLESLIEQFGINILEVNPAYTSQACSSCHHTEKANRPERSKFQCKVCFLQIHADVNAARNILYRRSDKVLASIYTHKHTILQRLRKLAQERFTKRCHSPAVFLMDEMPAGW